MAGRAILTLDDDERAVSVQIGAVILFGFVIIAMATWQAVVVPQENNRVEFEHNQRVQDDLQGVRNSVVGAVGGGGARSVGVDMAPQYPPRPLFVNPPQPTGTIRTVGTTNPRVNVTVGNATVVGDGEAADFWDGSTVAYNTGGVVYEPNYHVYQTAPVTIYENTVLYNRFEGGTTVRLAGQSVIDGTRISLVALNGSLSVTQSRTFTVDPSRLSGSSTTVTIEDSGENITISFASRRNGSWWTETLKSQIDPPGGPDEAGANVVAVRSRSLGGGWHEVTLELEPDESYTLRLAKVGVGSGATDPGAAYATDVAGNGSSVPEGGTQQVVVEVRDKFNNPVSGVTVTASASLGSLRDGTVTTNSEGEAVFTYEAPADIDGGQEAVELNVTFAAGVSPASGSFDGSTPANVSMTVYVGNSDGSGLGGGGGDGGTYSIDWRDPSGEPGTEEPCDTTNCVWNVSGDDDLSLTLTADTSPTVEDLDTEFAVNDSSVAYVSTSEADTGDDGVATMTLTATSNGTVKVYVITGDSSDAINVTVTDFSPSLVFAGNATVHNFDGDDSRSSVASFNVSNQFSSNATITAVLVNSTSAPVDYLYGNNDITVEVFFDNDGDLNYEPGAGDGYAADDNDKMKMGEKVSLDVNAVVPGGESATIWLGEFYESKRGGQEVDMTGETVTVTVYYEVNGKTYVTTFEVQL